MFSRLFLTILLTSILCRPHQHILIPTLCWIPTKFRETSIYVLPSRKTLIRSDRFWKIFLCFTSFFYRVYLLMNFRREWKWYVLSEFSLEPFSLFLFTYLLLFFLYLSLFNRIFCRTVINQHLIISAFLVQIRDDVIVFILCVQAMTSVCIFLLTTAIITVLAWK